MSDIQSLSSCFLVSTLIVSACYGVTIAQTIYFHRYRDDSTTLKSYVGSLFVLDSVKMLSTCSILWKYLVYGHDDYIQLTHWPTEEQLVWTFSAITICAIQLFYFVAIWRLLHGCKYRLPVTVAGALCAITTLAADIAVFYEIQVSLGSIPMILQRLLAPARLQSAMELVTNVYIAAALTVILRKFKTRGQTMTKNIIGTLVTYIVNRGILLLVIQVLEISSYHFYGSGFSVSTILFICNGTVNVNMVLIALNNRQRIRSQSEHLNGENSIPFFEIQVETNPTHNNWDGISASPHTM